MECNLLIMVLRICLYVDCYLPLIDFLNEENIFDYSYWRRRDGTISMIIRLGANDGNMAARAFDIGYKVSQLERKRRV